MAATTGYLDIGAVQRIESGSETPKTGYLDIGAVQRQETAAGGRGLFLTPPMTGVGIGGSFFRDPLQQVHA